MLGKKVLVVEDDIHINRLVELAFTAEGAEVFVAADGQEGLRKFYNHKPDIVIMDLMMPEMDGWEASRRILELADVPIIMLTSLHDDEDVIRGLEQGAIDYVTKPFAPRVLVARAKVALRQNTRVETNQNHLYHDGRLSVNFHEQRVHVDGQSVKLTKTEYKLLSYFLQNVGRVLTFQQILEHVWGWEYQDSIEYVHVYISRLRQKLEQDARSPRHILTEHGIGYRFEKVSEK